MKLVMCSIRDSKVGAFMRPFFVRSVGEAIRVFSDDVNGKDAESVLRAHPEDFSLWHFGDFDDTVEPHLQALPSPVVLVKAVDVKVPDVVRS